MFSAQEGNILSFFEKLYASDFRAIMAWTLHIKHGIIGDVGQQSEIDGSR